jgi:hypothetical protein
MKRFLFVTVIAFSTQLFAQDQIPGGTILPVQLNSSLRSDKARVGEQVSARVMQDVPLLAGRKIHSGAKVIGHVVSARPADNGAGGEISLRLDTLEIGKRHIPMTTNLRALATMMDVSEAQIPESGPDRGTSEYNWTTDQIGGEVDYRGGGAIVHAAEIVGHSVPNGVLVRVSPKSGMKCRGEFDGNDRPQALWVFSSDACGLYDFPGMILSHAGRTDPVGQITLLSSTGNLNIRAGSGMLLRITSKAPDARSNPAAPGTVNYIEGQTSIDSHSLNSNSIRWPELRPGQSFSTGRGKAEILLTPGVFLRVGNNSSVKISPRISGIEVGVDKGHAMIEVADIDRDTNIFVTEGGARTRLVGPGLYDFNLNQDKLRVFDGKAVVEDGRSPVKVEGGHEITVASNDHSQPQHFSKKSYEEGDLYRWSSLRSAYLAEANVDAAHLYEANGWGPWGPGWCGADWYWDPWFDAFTFIPEDGIFYSTFGWGFYSPRLVFKAPFYPERYDHRFSTDNHSWGPGSHYVAGRNYASGIYNGPG